MFLTGFTSVELILVNSELMNKFGRRRERDKALDAV
jgi:hypothetical protein